jgi:hypothetical protein
MTIDERSKTDSDSIWSGSYRVYWWRKTWVFEALFQEAKHQWGDMAT